MIKFTIYNCNNNSLQATPVSVPPVGLTKREIDALRLIARGATDRDVARELGISQSTAHEHFEKAKRKLNVTTRSEAIAIAVSLAIVAP